ncbi:MAG: AraC family transcriptional regulator [Cyclobacteriaceae bacterium]|nr:AraC family transcriptional regulator [Cyclobacteriaceae bacterium]MCH8515769.1 AraC family transcriptional regulator [Cyclobacteriaceae bacterium]
MNAKSLFDRRIDQLVEHRTSFNLEDLAELNIFETWQKAEMVELQFSSTLLVSMIQGRKIMHLKDRAPFEFMPGQSLVMPSNELMQIDFPDATLERPTRCMALAIAPEEIQSTVNWLNECRPKDDSRWQLNDANYAFSNDSGVNEVTSRIIRIAREDNPAKKQIIQTSIRELIIRLMQTEAREIILKNYHKYTARHRFAHVVNYINENLEKNFNMDELAEKACMSTSRFYKNFKAEFGITPLEYIQRQKIDRSKRYLKSGRKNVGEVAFAMGYSNTTYFIKLFRKFVGLTPAAYQKRMAILG